ncbi:MAG TPA: BsuPI-related putative proteinase inhibitor [Bacillota bacterium]|nr:BsuPI-related putative proteinase inhibitor [Bacillota bacterium]
MATTYTVKPGDTLFAIAQRFGTTAQRLARVNNITNPDMIFPGQVLTIPEGGEDAEPAGANAVSRRIEGLLYTIYTDKSVYGRGEPVAITLVKNNVSGSSITLRYRTSQRFDFAARRGAEPAEIWRWSSGRRFTQVTERVVLAPGESQVFRAVWNQRDNRGRQVAAGTFAIEGFNFAEGFRNRGISTTIRIRAAVPTPTPTPTATPCPDVNILVNPGFEDWPRPASPPAGWTGSNLSRSTLSRRGNYAVELGARHNERAVLSQRVDIEAGRIYDLIWWARENVQPGGVGRFVLFVEIFYYSRTGEFVGRTEPRFSQENIPNNTYDRYSLSTGRIPAGARTAEVRFTFEPSAVNNNTVKIDDVELRCRF